MHQVGEHSGPLAGQKLPLGFIAFVLFTAKTDTRNLNSAVLLGCNYLTTNPGSILSYKYIRACPSRLGMSLVMLGLLSRL